MEHELKNILATDIVPAELTIIYDDMHGLWGGTTITVRGDGTTEKQTRETGAPEATISRKHIDQLELIDLIRLLVELKAWEQFTAEEQPVAGESRARLTLTLNDSSSRVWERVNDMPANDRLIQFKSFLETLSQRKTTEAPTYSADDAVLY